MLYRSHQESCDVAVISSDLVALVDLGDRPEQLLENMQLTGEGFDSHDRLQRVTERFRFELHGERSDDAARLETAQSFGHRR